MATGTIKNHKRTYKKITTQSQTISAGSTKWFGEDISTYKNVGLNGYYFEGTGNAYMNVYAVYIDENASQVTLAAVNAGSITANVKVHFYISYDA